MRTHRKLRVFPVLLAGCSLALGIPAHPARAQASVTTPRPGSTERKAIMDALRFPVSTELKQKVIFVVTRLKVQKSYAFTIAQPQQPNGKRVDYSQTEYARAIKEGAFDDQVVALLKKRGKQWRVLTYNIGATDVVWEGWDKKYGAPAAIFK